MRAEACVRAVMADIRGGTKVERWKLGKTMAGWKDRRKKREAERWVRAEKCKSKQQRTEVFVISTDEWRAFTESVSKWSVCEIKMGEQHFQHGKYKQSDNTPTLLVVGRSRQIAGILPNSPIATQPQPALINATLWQCNRMKKLFAGKATSWLAICVATDCKKVF